MSFSKAKLKRFNDVDVVCGSPAATGAASAGGLTPLPSAAPNDRKEQIEKFFKEAVRFASNTKESKEGVSSAAKDTPGKEDKKYKGLRLFRTPSLPQRLRFKPHPEVSSTPLSSASSTPQKSASRLKGKEALQQDIRKKSELIENYLSQIDVLQRQ